jgi:hypothetical protein
LSVEDTNLYAEANAVFMANSSKQIKIPIVLQVSKSKSNRVKWMIAGVANYVYSDKAEGHTPQNTNLWDSSKYIPLTAYATDFVCLNNILSRNMEAKYYFTSSLSNTKNGQSFISGIQSGALKFNYIEEVKFHFFQVPQWEMIVEYFQRNEFNSGWLINNIRRHEDSLTYIPSYIIRASTKPTCVTKYDSSIVARKAVAATHVYNELMNSLCDKCSEKSYGKKVIATYFESPEKIFYQNAQIETEQGQKDVRGFLEGFSKNYSPNSVGSISIDSVMISPLKHSKGQFYVNVSFVESFNGKSGKGQRKKGDARVMEIIFKKENNIWKSYIRKIMFANSLSKDAANNEVPICEN